MMNVQEMRIEVLCAAECPFARAYAQTFRRSGMFTTKLDSNGETIWTRQFYSHNNSFISDILINNDKLFMTGALEDTTYFSASPTIPVGNHEMFIAEFDTSGSFLKVYHNGYISNSLIKCSDNETIYNISMFYNNFTTSQATYTSHGFEDILLTKWDFTTGINEPERQSNELLIYTNPSLGQSNIRIPEALKGKKNVVLTIYSNDGKIIQSQTLDLSTTEIRIDISKEAKGMYAVTLTNGNLIYRGKVIFE